MASERDAATALTPVLPEGATTAADQAVALIDARDLQGLHEWLSAGNDPNLRTADGWSPVLRAAARGPAEALELIIQTGKADLRQRLTWPSLNVEQPDRVAPGVAHLVSASRDLRRMRAVFSACNDLLHVTMGLNNHDPLMNIVFYFGIEEFDAFIEMAMDVSDGQYLDDAWHDWGHGTVRGLSYEEMATQFGKTELAAAGGTLDTLAGDGPGALPAANRHFHLGDSSRPRPVRNLQQPALIFAGTGGDANADVTRRRTEIVRTLLDPELCAEAGLEPASPLACEAFPMGAGITAVIRFLVFGHLSTIDVLEAIKDPAARRRAINAVPRVNGLTGVHDLMMRAATAPAARLPDYLTLIRYVIANGADLTIEDYNRTTQIAIMDNPQYPNRQTVMETVRDALASRTEFVDEADRASTARALEDVQARLTR